MSWNAGRNSAKFEATRDLELEAMNVLALCSGIGGLELGVKLAVPAAKVVCHVEREAFCAAVLVARMEDGSLDSAPIWSDLPTFEGGPWRGVVDCITAGFPCQPHSVAGRRGGVDDERWLWPDIVRIICEVRPGIVFLENVPGLLTSGGFDRVLGDLAEIGFNAEWDCITAAQCGAPHLRERLFILAANPSRPLIADADNAGRKKYGRSFATPPEDEAVKYGGPSADGEGSSWSNKAMPQPAICGMDDGARNRVDRLRACGNGIVPQQAAEAWRILWRRLD